jgi:V8-like Glu-specific endopeptidase
MRVMVSRSLIHCLVSIRLRRAWLEGAYRPVVAPPESVRKGLLRSPSHPFEGIKEVGTFYWADRNADGELYYRFCAGTVVPSPGKNLVLTAAHCFDSADRQQNMVFVPQHSKNKPQPHGIFPIAKGQIYADPRYMRRGGDKDFTDLDFAILKTEPRSDGRELQDVVGAIPIGYSTAFDHPKTRVIGYPGFKAKQDPLDCTSPMRKFSTGDAEGWKGGTFSQIDCDGYVSGTSGGPFITAGSENPQVVGVTAGWMTGGHSADTSYSSYFDGDLKRIYEAAVARQEAGPHRAARGLRLEARQRHRFRLLRPWRTGRSGPHGHVRDVVRR